MLLLTNRSNKLAGYSASCVRINHDVVFRQSVELLTGPLLLAISAFIRLRWLVRKISAKEQRRKVVR